MVVKSNTVSLNVDGVDYSYWESASISSELNTVSPSFSLAVTAKVPNGSTSIQNFKVGSKVVIKIDDDTVISGYIDKTPLSYTATSVSAQVEGRSCTEDIIDCTVVPIGDDKIDNFLSSQKQNRFSSISKSNNGEFVDAPNTIAVHWNNEKLETIIAQIIKPYGIKLVRECKPLDKRITFGASPTDTVLKALQDLTKSEDLLFYGDEYGNLVVSEIGLIDSGETLVLGGNVKTGQASFDGSQIFSHYRVNGQKSGSNTAKGKAASDIHYTSENVSIVQRFRLKTESAKGQGTAQSCNSDADGNKKFSSAQFFKITYTVQGWRKPSDNKLWKINSTVNVDDPILGIGISDGKFLITKVTFNLDNSNGMTTTLEVVPPDGYKVDKASTSSNKGKNKQSTNWSFLNR